MNNIDTEGPFHVVSLLPHHQSALKFCLFHLFSLQAIKAVNAVMANPCYDQAEASSDIIISMFSEYDHLTSQWPLISDIKAKGTNKMYYYSTNKFAIMKTAINSYDERTAAVMLGTETASEVNFQMPSLRKLFDESANFQYSMAEIQQGMVRR